MCTHISSRNKCNMCLRTLYHTIIMQSAIQMLDTNAKQACIKGIDTILKL